MNNLFYIESKIFNIKKRYLNMRKNIYNESLVVKGKHEFASYKITAKEIEVNCRKKMIIKPILEVVVTVDSNKLPKDIRDLFIDKDLGDFNLCDRNRLYRKYRVFNPIRTSSTIYNKSFEFSHNKRTLTFSWKNKRELNIDNCLNEIQLFVLILNSIYSEYIKNDISENINNTSSEESAGGSN